MSTLKKSLQSLKPDSLEIDVVRTMARALPANGLATSVDASVRKVVERPGHAAWSAPFVWQAAERLLVLDAAARGRWVLAEWRFGEERPGYIETFRAGYASPREAMGALMARALADGDLAAMTAAAGLDAWYSERTR
jgi:hypothetical protein